MLTPLLIQRADLTAAIQLEHDMSSWIKQEFGKVQLQKSLTTTCTEVKKKKKSNHCFQKVGQSSTEGVNSLNPDARACSLAHIAHSIFPIVFTWAARATHTRTYTRPGRKKLFIYQMWEGGRAWGRIHTWAGHFVISGWLNCGRGFDWPRPNRARIHTRRTQSLRHLQLNDPRILPPSHRRHVWILTKRQHLVISFISRGGGGGHLAQFINTLLLWM